MARSRSRSPVGGMHIFVKPPKGARFRVFVGPNLSIRDVKGLIEPIIDIPPELMCLRFGKDQLRNDSSSLAVHSIVHGSVLQLGFRVAGQDALEHVGGSE